jgi:hypothetical protein
LIQSRKADHQAPLATNFIGGHPLLRPDDDQPSCDYCHRPLTFFLQVTPPDGHSWAGSTIALFECTVCHDETPNEFLSPGREAMTWQEAEEQGIEVDDRFLAGSQRHRRLVISKVTDVAIRTDIAPHIEHRSLAANPVEEPYLGMKVGGVPSWSGYENWIFEEARYANQRVTFLFQVPTSRRFTRLPSAPLRNDFIQGSWPERPEDMEQGYYDLFAGLPTYCFGVLNRDPPAAYLIPAAAMAANRQDRPLSER